MNTDVINSHIFINTNWFCAHSEASVRGHEVLRILRQIRLQQKPKYLPTYPPTTYLPTYLSTYLPTHPLNNQPTYLTTHPLTNQPTYLLPTHVPT